MGGSDYQGLPPVGGRVDDGGKMRLWAGMGTEAAGRQAIEDGLRMMQEGPFSAVFDVPE